MYGLVIDTGEYLKHTLTTKTGFSIEGPDKAIIQQTLNHRIYLFKTLKERQRAFNRAKKLGFTKVYEAMEEISVKEEDSND